jgi:hypothetical protein
MSRPQIRMALQKVVLDDGELTLNDLRLEYRTLVLSYHPPYVVGDCLDPHQPESSIGE